MKYTSSLIYNYIIKTWNAILCTYELGNTPKTFEFAGFTVAITSAPLWEEEFVPNDGILRCRIPFPGLLSRSGQMQFCSGAQGLLNRSWHVLRCPSTWPLLNCSGFGPLIYATTICICYPRSCNKALGSRMPQLKHKLMARNEECGCYAALPKSLVLQPVRVISIASGPNNKREQKSMPLM